MFVGQDIQMYFNEPPSIAKGELDMSGVVELEPSTGIGAAVA